MQLRPISLNYAQLGHFFTSDDLEKSLMWFSVSKLVGKMPSHELIAFSCDMLQLGSTRPSYVQIGHFLHHWMLAKFAHVIQRIDIRRVEWFCLLYQLCSCPNFTDFTLQSPSIQYSFQGWIGNKCWLFYWLWAKHQQFVCKIEQIQPNLIDISY